MLIPCNFLMLFRGRTRRRGQSWSRTTRLDGPGRPLPGPWQPPRLPSRVPAAPPPTRRPGWVWGNTMVSRPALIPIGGSFGPDICRRGAGSVGLSPGEKSPRRGVCPREGLDAVTRTCERPAVISPVLGLLAPAVGPRPRGGNGDRVLSSAMCRRYARDLPQLSTSRRTGGRWLAFPLWGEDTEGHGQGAMSPEPHRWSEPQRPRALSSSTAACPSGYPLDSLGAAPAWGCF